ncbi:MAG: lamin tail domain-containing protein [Verrucomicrobiales bacterium]
MKNAPLSPAGSRWSPQRSPWLPPRRRPRKTSSSARFISIRVRKFDLAGAVEREFIELHNVSAAAVDVSGWAIDRGVSFTFPGGTSIPAGGYLAVAADVGAFSAAHPGVGPVVGGWSGS